MYIIYFSYLLTFSLNVYISTGMWEMRPLVMSQKSQRKPPTYKLHTICKIGMFSNAPRMKVCGLVFKSFHQC